MSEQRNVRQAPGAADPDTARRSVLTPLEPEGRAEVVADRLREAIFLGILPDGQPLPSEADLSVELGVSTKTLREALAALRQEGLIETRRGRAGGSFVRARRLVSRRFVRNKLAAFSASEIRDLSDEHRAISGTAALLAASRADDDQLQRLESFIAALESAATPIACGLADSQFHIEVAVASQSERLTRAEVLLQQESRDLLWFSEPPFDQAATTREHREILTAISAQDGEGARALAERHMMAKYRHLLELRLKLRAQ